jgi:hypothetical protein
LLGKNMRLKMFFASTQFSAINYPES